MESDLLCVQKQYKKVLTMNIQRKMDFNLIVISLPQLMSKTDKSVTGRVVTI